IGSDPDHRAQQVCSSNGITLYHKARQVKLADFQTFDYILAMDTDNYNALKNMASHDRLFLMRSFDPMATDDKNVPDPYYGGLDGFKEVYEMLHRSANGFVDYIVQEDQKNNR
ncbi:MAG TPA: hypothetical protein VK750_07780, partial [Cytophagaceae bacterium]|nr:hypothetical protein [Cytophagaceae bacterium]